MKLMEIDPETQMPKPTAEALTIDVFYNLWRRVIKIDGDRDGRKKVQNLREFGYIWFSGVYNSRFKLYNDKEKEIKIKELVKLPPDWVADDLVQEGLRIMKDSQISASSDLVESIEGTAQALSLWMRVKKESIRSGAMTARDVKEVLDIIRDIPNTVDTLNKAKETLNREQDALASGRKGRSFNKFEMPN